MVILGPAVCVVHPKRKRRRAERVAAAAAVLDVGHDLVAAIVVALAVAATLRGRPGCGQQPVVVAVPAGAELLESLVDLALLVFRVRVRRHVVVVEGVGVRRRRRRRRGPTHLAPMILMLTILLPPLGQLNWHRDGMRHRIVLVRRGDMGR